MRLISTRNRKDNPLRFLFISAIQVGLFRMVTMKSKHLVQKEESLLAISAGGFLTLIKKRAATYSPARRSTIGVDGLNFSVRNGKRWNPVAIAT